MQTTHHAAGGLRLLVQQWQEGDPDRSNTVMPFDKQVFDNIVDVFHLPKSYPSDFTSGQYIPTRLNSIFTSAGTNIGFISSPYFDASN
jgi:hypothetical protein